MYIAIRTDDGRITGKIQFYCDALQVSRQAFYDYRKRKEKSWKYQPLADAMLEIHEEDEGNADYGRIRMYQVLKYKEETGELDDLKIPSEGTVRKVMKQIQLRKVNRYDEELTKDSQSGRRYSKADL